MYTTTTNLATTGTQPLVWIWGGTAATHVPTCWPADDPRDRDRWDPPRVLVDRVESVPRPLRETRSAWRVAVRAIAMRWWRGLSREMARPLFLRVALRREAIRHEARPPSRRCSSWRREPGRPSRSRVRRTRQAAT